MSTIDLLFGQRKLSGERDVGKATERAEAGHSASWQAPAIFLAVLVLLAGFPHDIQAACEPGTMSFGSTGADQSFTTPDGCFSIRVKLWGAGGGGGDSGVVSGVTSYGYGGGGGYSTGIIAVSPGQVRTIIVGSGGAQNPHKGSGGGRSAIRTADGVELITAGGGGGAAGVSFGGAGGGLAQLPRSEE